MKIDILKNRSLGIVISYTNTILNMICGLVISSLLLRLLGDTEYGIYKTITSFAGMLVMFEFGTGTVMTRNITLCRGKNEDISEVNKNISTIWSITTLLALIIIFISVLFYFSIDNIYYNSMNEAQIQYSKIIFIFVIIHLIVVFLTQTLNGIILAYEYYAFSSIMNIFTIISRTFLIFSIVSRFRYSIVVSIVDAVIGAIILILTLIFCVSICKVKITYSLFDKKIFRGILPLSCALFLQTIINQMNNNIDNFLIGIELNPESVALYSIALYIYTVFSSATTIPISLYAPQIIGNVSKGISGKELTDTLINPSRLIVFVGGNILFGFIAVGEEFLEIVYGYEYIKAWSISLILMIPTFINMTTGVLINVLDALNKRMVRSNILIFTTVINFILTLILMEGIGVLGAALATAISIIIGQIIIMHIYYSKKIGIHVIYLFYKSYKGILIFQIIGMIVSLLMKIYFKSTIVSFIVCSLIYVVISLSGYILIGTNDEEKNMITNLKKRLSK